METVNSVSSQPSDLPEPSRQERPTVIYIAGAGRSGSTLLERTLGAMPRHVNVGELLDLFRRVARADERCGCGELFSRCPFWTEVGAVAFGGWDDAILTEFTELQVAVARQRRMPAVLRQQLQSTPSRELARYRALHRSLYAAILQVADADVVVDASKWPSQALALCGEDIDLRVVNVVRDVRGVAYSMGKRDVIRPQSGASGVVEMDRRGVAEAAARWTLTQAETKLVSRFAEHHTSLAYEDLVTHPRESVSRVLTDLGVPFDPEWLAHVGTDAIDLPSSHGLSGNPSRFAHGSVALRHDLAWTTRMPRSQRLTATAIAAPILITDHLTKAARGTPMTIDKGVTSHQSPRPEDASREWPLVSVVVTTRGRPELVRETLAGIVQQDYPGEMEILVVHDQEEPDHTLTKMGAAGRTVEVMLNTAHAPGLAGARNSGLDAARGTFIATSDDDDVWHPGKLRAQVRLLSDEPDLLAVGSGIRLLFPGRIVEWQGRSPRISQKTLLRNRVKELHSSTLVMRRETFARAGQYAENLPHGYAEDYEFLLRVAQVGAIGVVREPLADIRKDNQSWFLQRAENTSEALTFLLKLHPELKTSRPGHARILGQIAFAQSSLGHRRAAFKLSGQALLRYPVAPHAYLALAQATTGVDPRRALGLARRFGRGLS